MDREVFVAAVCPLGGTCQAEGRPCGALRSLSGIDSRIVTLKRGDRLETGYRGQETVRTVHSGLAAVCATLPDGRRQLLCLSGPGEALCAASVTGLACWIEALAPSVVCEIQLVPEHLGVEQLGEARVAMGELARARLESTFAHMVSLGRLDGTERVMAFLADMARRIGRRDGEAWRVPLLMTRDDIADHLGLNADTITRILRRLQAEGLVLGREGPELLVPDLAALEARAPWAAADPQATASAGSGRCLAGV